MPKAVPLTDETMTAPPVPQAAQMRPQTQEPASAGKRKTAAQAEPNEPLQVRWPRQEIKAAKRAALDGDFATVSDFMLACFHAYMKSSAQ